MKLRSPGLSGFQLRVEIPMVTRNGIWVTTMVNTSAGSSGRRRRHRSAAPGCEVAFAAGPAGDASAVKTFSGSDAGRREPAGPRRAAQPAACLLSVLARHLLGELLPVVQR